MRGVDHIKFGFDICSQNGLVSALIRENLVYLQKPSQIIASIISSGTDALEFLLAWDNVHGHLF